MVRLPGLKTGVTDVDEVTFIYHNCSFSLYASRFTVFCHLSLVTCHSVRSASAGFSFSAFHAG